MSKIDELKKQLQKEELAETRKNLDKELQQLKDTYEGKCFATNTFERSHAGTSLSATHYEKFFIKEDKINTLSVE